MSNPAKSIELHSPLSPLSPGSPTFPDVIFCPQWFAKHQRNVPCQIVAFFAINAEAGEVQDTQIKADIQSCRAVLSCSGFKTRFSAVLVSDQSILHAPELEDRLNSIRRATSLDSKTGLFFMPPMSNQAEIDIFAQTTVAALQPSIIEYYRDLTKHTRRKKSRGAPPFNAALSVHGGTSRALSASGWNARYELKLGVFAEFRQEMELAERHYESTIEELMSSEGVFETVPSWSPRWNETRLLCDAVAIRTLRCQLWLSSTTIAARSWSNYRARMKDLIDQRGRGSESYSWEAWEARWAHIMAQLITNSDLPVFRIDDTEEGQKFIRRIYAPPDQNIPGTERLPPFHLLHHAGYWHRLSGQKLRARRERALAIPEEDRLPPGQSPASAVAKRSGMYDNFLAPDPHEEASLAANGGENGLLRHIAENHGDASVELLSRGQDRLTDNMAIELANDYMDMERFEDAYHLLNPIWGRTTWREDTWVGPLSRLLSTLHRCAVRCGYAEVALATAWELLCTSVSRHLSAEQLPKTLEPANKEGGKVEMSYSDAEGSGPIHVAFAFGGREAHVGEPLECQLQVSSNARLSSGKITMSRVKVRVGQSRKITILHQAPVNSGPGNHHGQLAAVGDLTANSDGTISGKADLSFESGQQRILTFPITFREADEVYVRDIDYTVVGERFEIRHQLTDALLFESPKWYYRSYDDAKLIHSYLPQFETTKVMVLSKPPKIQLELHALRSKYYINEPVALTLQVHNGEGEVVNARVSNTVATEDDSATLDSKLQSSEESGSSNSEEDASELAVPSLQRGASHKMGLLVQGSTDPATFKLAIDVRYTLESDPDTELLKTLHVDLSFVSLLDTGFSFGPLYHPDQWPNYFAPPSKDAGLQGLRQRWRLGVALASLVGDGVDIKDAEIQTDHVVGDAICHAELQPGHELQALKPKENVHLPFELETTKNSIDDRRPIALELTLAVTWSRNAEDSQRVVTKLPVPRLNLPNSEPRALCTVSERTPDNPSTTLHFHLENPSLHFLTFALTMEASEDFAFSGPKYRTLSLAPFSRHSVHYQLLLHDAEAGELDEAQQGTWVWPALQVVDSYYQKTLRVQAAGPGVKNDIKGRVGVLVKTD